MKKKSENTITPSDEDMAMLRNHVSPVNMWFANGTVKENLENTKCYGYAFDVFKSAAQGSIEEERAVVKMVELSEDTSGLMFVLLLIICREKLLTRNVILVINKWLEIIEEPEDAENLLFICLNSGMNQFVDVCLAGMIRTCRHFENAIEYYLRLADDCETSIRNEAINKIVELAGNASEAKIAQHFTGLFFKPESVTNKLALQKIISFGQKQ